MNFVRNTVDGFVHVGLHEKSIGEVINLGSDREISIGDLANLIAKLIGTKIEIKIDQQRIRPRKSEVERLLCDFSKAKELTGWTPKYTLEDGLKETIEWIRNNLKYFKTDIYNV